MSKAQAMQVEQQRALRPPKPPPPPPPRGGAIWRWVRQAEVPSTRTWRPWWGLGLVEVVTHPLPRWRARRMVLVPGCRAYAEFPARAPFWVAA